MFGKKKCKWSSCSLCLFRPSQVKSGKRTHRIYTSRDGNALHSQNERRTHDVTVSSCCTVLVDREERAVETFKQSRAENICRETSLEGLRERRSSFPEKVLSHPVSILQYNFRASPADTTKRYFLRWLFISKTSWESIIDRLLCWEKLKGRHEFIKRKCLLFFWPCRHWVDTFLRLVCSCFFILQWRSSWWSSRLLMLSCLPLPSCLFIKCFLSNVCTHYHDFLL